MAVKHFQVDTGGTLTQGLVSYYKLYADGSDYWGTNPFTGEGTPTFTSGHVGGANALTLNGSSQDLVRAGTNGGFNFAGGDFSWSGWVNFGSRTSGVVWGGFKSPDLFFIIYTDASNLHFAYSTNGSTPVDLAESWSGSTGTWYYITAWRSGSTGRLYVNNSQIGTDINLGSSVFHDPTNASLWFGNEGNGSYLNGQIQDVGIWTKALSSQEMTDLYNGGAGQTMVDTAIVRNTGNMFFQFF